MNTWKIGKLIHIHEFYEVLLLKATMFLCFKTKKKLFGREGSEVNSIRYANEKATTRMYGVDN